MNIEDMIGRTDYGDPASVLMLSDALEEAGRDAEAALCREKGLVLNNAHVIGNRIMKWPKGNAVVIDLYRHRRNVFLDMASAEKRQAWARAMELTGSPRHARVQRALAGWEVVEKCDAPLLQEITAYFRSRNRQVDSGLHLGVDNDLCVMFFDPSHVRSSYARGPYLLCRKKSHTPIQRLRKSARLEFTEGSWR